VTIPDSVVYIADGAFVNCTGLTNILVHPNSSNYSSADGVLFNKTQTSLIRCPEGRKEVYSIPNGVISIADHGFYGCNRLSGVLMSDSVTEIGNFSFYSCTNLAAVTLPDSVTVIGKGGFDSCTSLATVTIGSHVSTLGDEAFKNCTALSSIFVDDANPNFGSADGILFSKPAATLLLCPEGKTGSFTTPDSISGIGNQAFAGCAGLTDVTLGNSVSTIGDLAFHLCSRLTEVTLGNHVTNLAYLPFVGCTNLIHLKVDVDNPNYCDVDGLLFDKAQTTIILCPEGKAGNYAIPDGVIDIAGNAFRQCARLTSVTIPKSVTTIDDSAFYHCRGLTNLVMGDGVVAIGANAFLGCTNLTKVLLPEGITTIKSEAFSGCSGLTRVTIPDSATQIGYGAFSDCTSITQVAIGKGVSTIEGNAFSGCLRLTSVSIHSSVTSVGDFAFVNCNDLAAVYFTGNAPGLVGTSIFMGANSVTVYYLPGTTGWETTFAGRPTVLWDPIPQITGPADPFTFTITASSDLTVVVEAASSLPGTDWTPVGTNALLGGSSEFSDPDWKHLPGRFYRLRSP